MKVQRISDAIDSMSLISFRYAGRERVVEPHALWRDSQDRYQLDAWQVDGFSKSRSQPPWRTYNLDSIGTVDVLDEGFSSPREDYNPDADKYQQARRKL
ncbi:MAG: WYL domain-containing protein [Planctomycetaceae bacterium]|nr:WYL domain-containing protein [Planctomycetaceae bacterium]